jgi:hypothetical protein
MPVVVRDVLIQDRTQMSGLKISIRSVTSALTVRITLPAVKAAAGQWLRGGGRRSPRRAGEC